MISWEDSHLMHTGEVGTLASFAEEWFLFCSLAKSYFPNSWFAKLWGRGVSPSVLSAGTSTKVGAPESAIWIQS